MRPDRIAGGAYPHYAVSERTLAATEAMLAVDATRDLRRTLGSLSLLWT